METKKVYLQNVMDEAFVLTALRGLPENLKSTVKGYITAKFRLQLMMAMGDHEKRIIKELYFEIFGEALNELI